MTGSRWNRSFPRSEICGPVESAAVVETIVRLVNEGLLEEMRQRVIQPAILLADPIEFWFRMTFSGRSAWESASVKYPCEEA
jgi:hypothetical protein